MVSELLMIKINAHCHAMTDVLVSEYSSNCVDCCGDKEIQSQWLEVLLLIMGVIFLVYFTHTSWMLGGRLWQRKGDLQGFPT